MKEWVVRRDIVLICPWGNQGLDIRRNIVRLQSGSRTRNWDVGRNLSRQIVEPMMEPGTLS